jgi:hypothetical protein
VALLIHNKSDLPRAAGQRPSGLELSAMHSAGIDALCQEIAGLLVPYPPPRGAAVPFGPEQIEQIHGYLQRI